MSSGSSVSLNAVDRRCGPLASIAASANVQAGIDTALELGLRLGEIARPPGAGSTRDLWEAFATIASQDLGAARAIEPHLDGLAILEQAGIRGTPVDPSASTWGVFAAESPEYTLSATFSDGAWSLDGVKPWCSLADRLDRALVTAALPDGGRGLFDIDLHHEGIDVDVTTWFARGLSEIPSGPVRFTDVSARPVGEPGWYLTRPGFAWGGIGVAACWFGGAVGIARTLFRTLGSSPAILPAMLLGAVDERIQSGRRALAEAADLIDSGVQVDGAMLAHRVRATVADACEEILIRASHALGPGPLALDADHAKRVADLQLYIRQHHAEKDDASLGAKIARAADAPW